MSIVTLDEVLSALKQIWLGMYKFRLYQPGASPHSLHRLAHEKSEADHEYGYKNNDCRQSSGAPRRKSIEIP